MKSEQNKTTERRYFLKLAFLSSVSSTLLYPIMSIASTKTQNWEKQLKNIIGDKKPVEGRISIKVPETISHQNAIPVRISVSSPMTQYDYIEQIILIAKTNKNPLIGKFFLNPANGKAEISTFLKLPQSRQIIAIAKSNKNDIYIGRQSLNISIP